MLRGTLDPGLQAELFAIREQRPKPLRDDKAIASWNGLMLAALAQCGLELDRPDWLDAGRRLAEFLLGPLSTADGRLHRTWRAGVAKGTGYLSDYADVAHGLIELHVATGELRWLLEAHRLAGLAVDLFGDDEGGGFFQAPRDGEQLMARKKELDDQPTPSGNAMLAYVLLRLGRIWGDDELEQRGVGVLRLVRDTLVRVPTAFGWMLVALDQYLAPRREWAIIGPPDAPVARAALALRAPTDVVAFGPADDVPLLAGKTLVDGLPAVYACERFTCRLPVTDPAALLGLDRADLGVGQRREQRVERRLEDGVRRAGGAPDAVEAAERLVDDRRQVAVVPERRDAADREAGRGARLVGARGPSAEVLDAAVAGAQHHRRHVVDDEDERLDDLADVAAARGRGLLRRPRRVGQLANLAPRARATRGVPPLLPPCDACA